MSAGNKIEGLPLVTDSTRAQSENVETILNRLKSERVIIPDYQRDAEQWDERKESLFIESVLNNLTVPAFFSHNVKIGKSRWLMANNAFPLYGSMPTTSFH